MTRENDTEYSGNMENHENRSASGTPRYRHLGTWSILVVACLAAGLYVYSAVLRSIRYEIEVDREQIYAGRPDTIRIRAYGVNRHEGRVPFSRPTLSADILEGSRLVRIAPAGEGSSVLLIYDGIGEGEVLLRITVAGWPFPMLATIRIAAAVAAAGKMHPGDGVCGTKLPSRSMVVARDEGT
jgi:hypothetical protein